MTFTVRLFLVLFLFIQSSSPAQTAPVSSVVKTPANRVASFVFSENLINQLLQENLKSKLLSDVTITLDADHQHIVARGLLKIPTDDLKAINLEKGAGDFRFQVAIELKTTPGGHLILIFPLAGILRLKSIFPRAASHFLVRSLIAKNAFRFNRLSHSSGVI